jgi:hypothetical protein
LFIGLGSGGSGQRGCDVAAANELLSLAGRAYTYDANGNVKTIQTPTYIGRQWQLEAAKTGGFEPSPTTRRRKLRSESAFRHRVRSMYGWQKKAPPVC